MICERGHDPGYMIIEKIDSTSNKIDLFYKMCLRIESLFENKTKKNLNKIKKDFIVINEFRNSIAHANWATINKEGLLRRKIVINKEDGLIKFKKIKITPEDIKSKLKEIDDLCEKLFDYTESLDIS